MRMSLPFSFLICLSVVQLCVGDEPVEETVRRRKVSLLGGWTDRDPDSPEVQKATQHAVEMFNSKSKAKKMFKLVTITSAKSQVTNTIHYKVDTVLGKTKCLRSEKHDLKSCSLDQKRLNCTFDVTFNIRKNHHHLDNKKCKKVVKV